MTLVLDTSVLLELESADRRGYIHHHLLPLRRLHPEAMCVTAPTYSEVYLGVLKKSEKKTDAALKRLDEFSLLNTTRGSSRILAEIRKSAEDGGRPIPAMDLLIASIVMDNGMTLLTRDRHFQDIEGLDVILI